MSKLRCGKHHAPALQRSWDKHGESAFEFSIIEIVESRDQLLPREQHWIDALNSASPRTGFNVYVIAGSPAGTKRTPEQRAKLSAIHKGRKKTADHVRKITEVHIGAKRSDATRAKMSAIHKGKTISDAQKAQISARHKGKKHSPETLAKMAESRRITRGRKLATGIA